MAESPQIFVDPSGQRSVWIPRILTVLVLILSGLLTLFALSLAAYTVSQPTKMVQQLTGKESAADRVRADATLTELKTQIMARRRAGPAPLKSADRVVLGFYAPWETSGRDSLKANADKLTHLAPVWLRLTANGKVDTRDFDLDANPNNAEVIRRCVTHGLRIVPVIANATEGNFDAKLVHDLLHNEAEQIQLVDWLVTWCKKNRFQGINFDLEEVADEDYPQLGKFLKIANQQFRLYGLELSLDVQTDTQSDVLAQWAEGVDYLVLMGYDQHSDHGDAGPIAAIDWFDREVTRALDQVPPDKLVVAIGAYGYDWCRGKPTEALTYLESLSTAQGFLDEQPAREGILFDPESLNSTFTYEDDQNLKHQVWLLDAPSAFNHFKIVQQNHVRGVGLWAVGSEDPSIWTFFDRAKLDSPPVAEELTTVSFPFEINYTGKGEILKVIARPQNGLRDIQTDKESGFIDFVEHQSYGSAYVIQKSGYVPKKLVLTFDDGPDPTYTPQILDVLKEFGVKASFYCIGSNIEANPDLVKRAYDEGSEIGNHSFTHPNLGSVRASRAKLEIAATTRIIEAVTGRSSKLFRPPYNADSQPSTPNEVAPVGLADSLGLITVGENVDPEDWNPVISDEDGETRERTAEDIAQYTIHEIERRKATAEEGNIILLHDAGGDRHKTVDALRTIIPALQQKGYEFVTVSKLLGKSLDDMMPPIPAGDRRIIGVDRFVFSSLSWGAKLLAIGFVSAIVLGTLRVMFIVPLAIGHHRAMSSKVYDPTYRPSVSVMIAAYNEESTIAGTLESVLRSEYPVDEVIVVNDGSADKTSESIRAVQAKHSAIKLIEKENGGKATALNVAIAEAGSDLILGIDADTQLDPQAIGLMVRHFDNDRVAAVAGNVQVGNIRNVLTVWQAVEYRTAQNMDRQAYAMMNGITVIPGAIGMWRRSVLDEVGGYLSDTLAEDMDLTWRIREAGYRMETEPRATALTEAPETWPILFKQRFRWAYGTLQCLVKHRYALGRYGFFGRVALPFMWLFQIVFQVLGPLVDLQLLVGVGVLLSTVIFKSSQEMSPENAIASLTLMLQLFVLFFSLELISGLVAYRMDRAKPWPLAWLLVQRFAYRQLMYAVIWRSLWRAALGLRQGWGKFLRTGSVGKS